MTAESGEKATLAELAKQLRDIVKDATAYDVEALIEKNYFSQWQRVGKIAIALEASNDKAEVLKTLEPLMKGIEKLPSGLFSKYGYPESWDDRSWNVWLSAKEWRQVRAALIKNAQLMTEAESK